MSGFVAMHRDALDHHLLQDGERFRAWFWLIANACWKPTKTRIKGQTIELQRGELSFSLRFLADAWGWSKSKVDRFICDLRDDGMIETRTKTGTSAGHKAGQGQSIITICNYSKYQDIKTDARDNDETKTGTSAGQIRTREQETKDISNEISMGPKRASRLPDDWEPVLTPASQRKVDGWPPGKLESELEAFRNHASDKGRTSKDWQAAFRTWIGKADEWHRQRKSAGGNGVASALDKRIGSDGFTRSPGRPAIGYGGGDSASAAPRIASLR